MSHNKSATKFIQNKKFQTNTQHQIVDLKIPFQDVEQKVILDNIREGLRPLLNIFCQNNCTDSE
jgi:hypothetical protein